MVMCCYRTVSVTHANIALEVQSRAASEPESFHVSKDLRFVESRIRPRPPESTDELFIDRASDFRSFVLTFRFCCCNAKS